MNRRGVGDGVVLTALFALTLALGAALLFSIQPMVARMALPSLGGTPAVWNTCMVFFQGAVLAGYALAHGLASRLCPRPQTGTYILMMAIGAGSLPIVLGNRDQPDGAPLWWLLTQLATQAGLPSVALAITAPLLQRWYREARAQRDEPYFLYAASNVGSFGALLAYPTLMERHWTLAEQSRVWSLGYGLWMVLVVACGAVMLRGVTRRELVQDLQAPEEKRPLNWRILTGWMALAAIPASLLQGCTLFLTTDIASVPLLWVVPLSLYLLSFVVAFSRRGAGTVKAAARALPFVAVSLLFAILIKATQPAAMLIGLHLGFLFLAGLVCHGRLVATRPAAEQLTAFYLALGLGGVLGGAFNVLVAPLLFTVVAEYPIAIALACAVLPGRARGALPYTSRWRGWRADLLWSGAIAAGMWILWVVTSETLRDLPRARDAILFGVPAIACCTLLDRPRRLALAMGLVFLSGFALQGRWSRTQHAERNFFGITRVTYDEASGAYQLFHGNTIHGRQFRDPSGSSDPLAYYHRMGPAGRIFEALAAKTGPRTVGVIGLGVGGLAAYAQPDEAWTFYEIDPAVIQVAHDTNWFTYLANSRAGSLKVIPGDGRLSLEGDEDGRFDLLILDAFSSDSIPVHLLTREAFQLYARKLRPDGWLVAHISNRYLSLEPLLAALAEDAGWICRAADDTMEGDYPGKEPSHWIWMARTAADMGPGGRVTPWVPAEKRPGANLWTDQRSSIVEVFEW